MCPPLAWDSNRRAPHFSLCCSVADLSPAKHTLPRPSGYQLHRQHSSPPATHNLLLHEPCTCSPSAPAHPCAACHCCCRRCLLHQPTPGAARSRLAVFHRLYEQAVALRSKLDDKRVAIKKEELDSIQVGCSRLSRRLIASDLAAPSGTGWAGRKEHAACLNSTLNTQCSEWKNSLPKLDLGRQPRTNSEHSNEGQGGPPSSRNKAGIC